MPVGAAFGALLGLLGLVWGFRSLSAGLRGMAGGRLEAALRGAGASPWRGFAAGAAVTALVHSSSVTTIFLVGCVDAGVVPLARAVPMIMGANLGTTVTAHLLAGAGGAPAVAWTGAALAALGLGAAAAPRRAAPGPARALLGAGLLLLALEALGRSLAPLSGQPFFAALLEAVAERPLLGVLVGALLTAAVLSSGVTIGLLQRLVAAGLVPLPAALPVLFGDNIGTTADTLLAGAAGGREARAAALAHLLFNLAGTVVLLPLAPLLAAPLAALVADPARQVAVAHTLFNAAIALALLPASGALAAASRFLAGLPERLWPAPRR